MVKIFETEKENSIFYIHGLNMDFMYINKYFVRKETNMHVKYYYGNMED